MARKFCKSCKEPAAPWRYLSARGLCRLCAVRHAAEIADASFPPEELAPVPIVFELVINPGRDLAIRRWPPRYSDDPLVPSESG